VIVLYVVEKMKKLIYIISAVSIMLAYSGCANKENKKIYALSDSVHIDLSNVARLEGTISLANQSFPLTDNGVAQTLIAIEQLLEGEQEGGATVLAYLHLDSYRYALWRSDFIDYPDEEKKEVRLKEIEEALGGAVREFTLVIHQFSDNQPR